MTSRRFFTILATSVLLSSVADLASAAPPTTRPVEGLRKSTPEVYALVGARIVVEPGRVIEKGTLVIRDGIIESVGADVQPPADARVIDLSGKTLYPGLIDAYGEAKIDSEAVQRGAPYWNPRITPQLRLAEHYKADSALNKKLRGQGITARLVAPSLGIIKGTSALVTTGDQSNDRAILKADVALHVRLTVSRGGGRDQYPNSPMGAVALARQTMYDAQWYEKASAALRADRTLPRPERNDALSALQNYSQGDALVIVDSLNEQYFLRADRFAHEFSLRIALRGSGHEYRRLEAIRRTGRAVIVPLDFPKPPNVGTAEAALSVTLEQLMHWDIAPENPARLERAGVKIALTSHGLKDQGAFLDAVRTAVKRGLSAEAALRAMTTTPAQMLGVSDRLGSLQEGRVASLLVTDGDLFADKTKVLQTWVDGRKYDINQPPLLDVRGTWQVTLSLTGDEKKSFEIQLAGQSKKLKGTVHLPDAEQEEKKKSNLDHVSLHDARLSATLDGELLGQEGVIQLTAVVSIPQDQPATWLGTVVWPDGSRSSMTAQRTAEHSSTENDAQEKDDSDKPATKKPPKASYAVNFPLGAFGRGSPPQQPQRVLFTNATIWTSSSQGVLKNASLLIEAGIIVAIGTDIKPPNDALVVDCRGKYISPGIIDCHSHMATDGGVNESAQAVTAEVRIGDFIDADDINIYRQLAGGVTCSNILHGSANPIGGQNQVIKLRWSMLGEEMKFSLAPQGVKFALGENVKQSNWGEKYTTRYPQTRMGVEQIVRDRFQAALHYAQQWERFNRTHQGLPPRRDLELDALDEILKGQRWIHCHSYRQDEILALIRTLDAYGVQIGTFQHILEGYKVADAMAKHGAMGSAFSDWWAYKFEVYDAIPYNGALMHNAGVVVSFNSDDRELARHLNHEAAKATKYGSVPPSEALKFVTLNPARQLRIDRYVGSLEVNKHADLVVWSGPPLSNFSRCEQTWIDGRKFFDRQSDAQRRLKEQKMRAALVQKILVSGQTMRKPGESDVDPATLWPRDDIFCHAHDRGNQQ